MNADDFDPLTTDDASIRRHAHAIRRDVVRMVGALGQGYVQQGLGAADLFACLFFATLRGANRYAVIFRVATAKKPETRARRIADFVARLERGETLHGPAKKS